MAVLSLHTGGDSSIALPRWHQKCEYNSGQMKGEYYSKPCRLCMMRQQEQACSTVSDRGDETDKVRAWLEVQQATRYEPTIGPKHGKRGAPCGTKGYHT